MNRGVKELEQFNPILYVFVGDVDGEIITGIEDIQRTRMGSKGIGYISVTNNEEEKGLAGTIKLNHFRFITKKYSSLGVIKVYYVVRADSLISRQLDGIKSGVEECLQQLYPTGISSVVFLLADDTLRADEGSAGCGETIRLVEGLQNDMCLTYLLTNVNNKNILAHDSYAVIAGSIALYALMKDFSAQKSGDNGALWNRQRFFIEDCLRMGKRLMSIGHKRIAKPSKTIENVLLLLLMENRTETAEQEAAFDYDFFKKAEGIVQKNKLISTDNILGLGVNADKKYTKCSGLTVGQAIAEGFGDGLSLFFDSMMEQSHTHIEAELKDMGEHLTLRFEELSGAGGMDFYKLCLWLKSLREQILKDKKDEAVREAELLNSRFESWLNGRVMKGSKRKLSILRSMDDTIYKIAEKYIAYRSKAKTYEVAGLMVDRAVELTDAFMQRYASVEELVSKHIKQIELDAIEADPKDGEIFTYNEVKAYYSKLFYEYAKDMPNDLKKLQAQMYAYAEADNLGEYVGLLRKYIREIILRSKVFCEPLHQVAVEVLRQSNRGSSNDEGYAGLIKWIVAQRSVQVMLKTGDVGLRSEVNVIADSRIAEKLNGLETAVGEKINIFYIDDYDEIDIIYHAGAFSTDELYYAELYT